MSDIANNDTLHSEHLNRNLSPAITTCHNCSTDLRFMSDVNGHTAMTSASSDRCHMCYNAENVLEFLVTWAVRLSCCSG